MKYYTHGAQGYIQDVGMGAHSTPHLPGHNVMVFCTMKGYSWRGRITYGAEKPLFLSKKAPMERTE